MELVHDSVRQSEAYGLEQAKIEASERLSYRIGLAIDLGAAVLGYETELEHLEIDFDFRHQLALKQSDLFRTICELEGRLFAIHVDNYLPSNADS